MPDDYERIRPGHVAYERVHVLKAMGSEACDALDHNEPGGCPRPGCWNRPEVYASVDARGASPSRAGPGRDIADYGQPNEIDTVYIQRKLQLAGEMKTAIKRFLDHFERTGGHDERRRKQALRKAMEDYLNCEAEQQAELVDAFHKLLRGENQA